MKVKHFKRLDNMNMITATKLLCCCFTYYGIHVDGIDSLNIGMLIHDATNRAEHIVHRFTEVFTAMCSNHNKAAAICPFQFRVVIIITNCSLQGINSSVACHIDALGILSFSQQILLGKLCRREMVLCHNTHSLTIELFRVWTIDIVSAQAGFHMTDSDLLVETSKGSYESGASITMNENHIRLHFI